MENIEVFGILIAIVSLTAAWVIKKRQEHKREVEGEPIPAKSRFDFGEWFWINYGRRLSIWWGMLFRTLFIAGIGFAGYHMVKPDMEVMNTPFAQLTIGALLGSILSIAIPLLCIGWFFKFPSRDDFPDQEPWVMWAQGSFWLFIVVVGLWYFFGRHK